MKIKTFRTILKSAVLISLFCCGTRLHGQSNLQVRMVTVKHDVPAGERITGFYNEVIIPPETGNNGTLIKACSFEQGYVGLVKDGVAPKVVLALTSPGSQTGIEQVQVLAKGENVNQTSLEGYGFSAEWEYNWQPGDTCKFYLTVLADSAKQTTDYTAYFFIPAKKQWKLLAGFRTVNNFRFLGEPYSILKEEAYPEQPVHRKIIFTNNWVQNDKREWKPVNTNKTGADTIKPKIDLSNNADSLAQAIKDAAAIAEYCKRTGMNCQGKDGINYFVIKPGNRPMAKLTDTLVVYYRGTLLDGTEFDKSGEEPATFPLNRLIKGWQTGLQLIGEGGRIQLMLPSAKAYGLRHLGVIVPNSVLIFDVEIERVKQ